MLQSGLRSDKERQRFVAGEDGYVSPIRTAEDRFSKCKSRSAVIASEQVGSGSAATNQRQPLRRNIDMHKNWKRLAAEKTDCQHRLRAETGMQIQ